MTAIHDEILQGDFVPLSDVMGTIDLRLRTTGFCIESLLVLEGRLSVIYVLAVEMTCVLIVKDAVQGECRVYHLAVRRCLQTYEHR